MRVIVTLAAAFCLGLGSAAAAESVKPAKASATAKLPPIDVPYEKFRLANGLTVVVHEDHKTPLVAVNVWYHIGSKDEPERRHGFAHLFEHLMFNGSEHFNDEFFRALEPAGATGINGTTNRDRTNYFETVPTAALDLALFLESDRMGHLLGAIDQKKLDEQRGVVLNEKRQGENQPYGSLREILSKEAYPPGHPYSWTTIGSDEDLNAATLDDVKAWFKRYYGPNNATLVLAGDITVAEARAKAEQYFGAIPASEPVSHAKAWAAPLAAEKRLEINDKVPLPRLYSIWNVPGDGERDVVLLYLFADVLASGKTGRLYERLVYRDQTASAISASVSADEIAGQFAIVASARPGASLAPIEAAVNEEVKRLLDQGPTDAELARIKTQRYADLLPAFDGVGAKGQLLAANEVFHGDPAQYKRELKWEQDATPADVRDAARRWLGAGRLVLEVLPENGLKPATEAVDRSKLPVPAASAALKLPPVARATLANGLKLAVIERRGVPLVEMALIVDAGRAADAVGKTGISAMTFGQLDEGAGTLDSLAIARRQAELGIEIGASSGREASMVTLSAIKPSLSAALDLYATIIRKPSFPQADLDRSKQNLKSAIVQEKASPGGLLRRVLSTRIYGVGHPYAYIGSGEEAVIDATTRDDLIAFHRRWLRPDNATLLVVGDTTLDEIRPQIEARFGDWKAPAEPKPVKTIPPVAVASAPRLFLLDKPGATQSIIAAANIAPDGKSAGQELMSTANTVLGGQFISRLNLNLREDKHWSYGASSSITRTRGPQVFLAQAQVERDRTADSIVEMQKELRDIVAKRPPSAAELDDARRADLLALPGSFETAGQVAAAFAGLIELEQPDDYFNTLPALIAAQTPDGVAAAAKALVKPEALSWFVVGDLAKIEAEVRKLKLGEVQVLDADGKVLR
ncbi:pitrilysin family protein [Nevskia sp.]|uniref:M16 family metallopeptidase n=1 Tax=Nevskia sp. TaxID=1929292 RepID=UPI0025E7D5C5|nr:pitrilysin family protein [Nevskia sp.]